MAPRRPKNGGGSSSGRMNTVSTNLALRESRPIPYTITPPSDPPSIRVNRPVDLTIDVNLNSTDTGIFQTKIVEGIQKVRPGPFNYTINYIHAWADPSSDASTINLKDLTSGVEMSDNGGLARRARVGIHYPRVLQLPNDSKFPSTAAIAEVSITSGDARDIELRIGVTVW